MSSNLMETFTIILHRQLTRVTAPRLAIAFSGGVDSSLLAKLCAATTHDVTLVTVGFQSARDIELSRTLQHTLQLPLVDHVFNLNEIEEGLSHVLQVIEWTRIARLEISLGFYFIFQLASAFHLSHVLSAHGTDELFCGYHAYRGVYSDQGALIRLMKKFVKTAQADKVEIDKLAKLFNIDYQCPFLSDAFIEYAMNLPLDLKITHQDDVVRKHLLRQVATELGVPPHIATRPKKAFQYSAGIHKALQRLAKNRGHSRNSAQRAGYKSALEAYIASFPQLS
jgi:asparagine synthase (glutamine-hydrolysing)